MTDSDWVAFENRLKVTWYKEGLCNVCGKEKKPFTGTLYVDKESLWIRTENPNKLDSLMICVDCFEILKNLVEIVKKIPKAERHISQKIIKSNKELAKTDQILKVFPSPVVWKVPEIQRRYLKEELK